jgi:hypothetical protein
MTSSSTRLLHQLRAQEHADLVRCYGEWERIGQCSPELWRRVCRHHRILRLLGEILRDAQTEESEQIPNVHRGQADDRLF